MSKLKFSAAYWLSGLEEKATSGGGLKFDDVICGVIEIKITTPCW